MKFSDFFWPDSDLEKVEIEYDVARLTIWNNASGCRAIVKCEKLAGITNLCVWDDTTILETKCLPLDHRRLSEASGDAFLQSLVEAYDGVPSFGGKNLEDGIVVLRFLLTNHIWFSVYCQSVEVVVSEDQVLR